MSSMYAKLLLPKGHGHPLWIPEPDENLPSEYRERGLSIGDVGIITPGGGFDVLFNACQPATHPINNDSVPEGFVPFMLEDGDIVKEPSKHSPGTVITSSDAEDGIGCHKGKYDDASQRIKDMACLHGAVLSLPDGASREDLVNVDKLRAHAYLNAETWYNFANVRRGRMAVDGALQLVTGCDKTKSWALGSFSRASNTNIAGQAINTSYSVQSEYYDSPQIRFGPITPSDTENQCVFFRGLVISLQEHSSAHENMIAVNEEQFEESQKASQDSASLAGHPLSTIHVKTPYKDLTVEKQSFDERGYETRMGLEPHCIGGTYTDIDVPSHRDMPLWSRLSHEHIVPLLVSHTNNNSLPTFEVPYYEQGNILVHNRRCPGANKLNQITQIAAGISYLHEHDVNHGNICSTNVLIKDGGGVCISDPTFNVLMYQLTHREHTPIPVTWCYKPPEELLSAIPMGPKADVYSWACVVYEVFCGKQPYHGYHYSRGIVEIINQGHRTLDRPLEISPQLWSIIQKCWVLEPERRPTMHQVGSELRGL